MKRRIFIGDFETTVYDEQESTEVWASACVEMFTEDVKIFNNIKDQIDYLISLNTNVIIYFHNLKFDGAFIISYLLNNGYEQAVDILKPEPYLQVKFKTNKEMKNGTFKYSISDRGMWYTITLKINNKFIEFRDSLKLLPFSISTIGKSFNTKHKKLQIDYEGYRKAYGNISDEEKAYITNDVLVPKEALELMYKEGHNKLTIGACCLEEFKKLFDKIDYANFFPNLYEKEIDENVYGSPNIGEYIRRSYRGGWCYLVKGKENKIFHNGTTADVNSLYPSMMHSQSGNRYPLGVPKFWKGDYIPEQALKPNIYYFVRIKTRFYLKSGKLPFIQIKGNLLYKGTESLESSDVYDKKTGKYYTKYRDIDGKIKDTRVQMTLTMTDWELIKEHYELVDCEILDGCYFYSEIGIFDEYIDKYKKIKMESKGAVRELAKLFLNNLYGKFAASTDSSFKYVYLKDDGALGYRPMLEYDKKPGFIPIGSAITSYSRNFTIRAAQANYYGADKSGFIYADTDSIHCDLKPEDIKGISVHDSNFCCWKLEALWDTGLFVRQKTYIEHVTHKDMQPVEHPFNNIKCAGMPQKCKDLFELSMQGYDDEDTNKYTEEEIEFLKTKRELTDFKLGLKVPGKLMPVQIKGGVLLVNTTYEMR